jgi:hypothetical protein
MTKTPTEAQKARAYAAEEALHPAIRDAMVQDNQGPGVGLWIAFALFVTASIMFGGLVYLLIFKAALTWFGVLP